MIYVSTTKVSEVLRIILLLILMKFKGLGLGLKFDFLKRMFLFLSDELITKKKNFFNRF